MKNFRSIIVCAFLIFLFTSSYAQENCPNLARSGEISFGLTLGMTIEEASAKLGKEIKIQTKSNDDFRFFQNFVEKKPPRSLPSVRAIYLRFFEKKLYQAEFFLSENAYPADIKTFAEIVSAKLALPTTDWKFAHRQAVFKCGETSLTIDYQLNPRIEITDEAIRAKVAEINKKK